MVVGNFYIVGIATFPPETDSVLVIDPDTELALPIAFQSFQPVIWQNCCVIEHVARSARYSRAAVHTWRVKTWIDSVAIRKTQKPPCRVALS